MLDEGTRDDDGGIDGVHDRPDRGGIREGLLVGLQESGSRSGPFREGGSSRHGLRTDERGALGRDSAIIGHRHRSGGEEGLAVGDLDVAVGLLIKNENVHESHLSDLRRNTRLGQDVELADLREALEHLDGLLICVRRKRKSHRSQLL